jgi:transcriptional regulator with XRE-family HTH domain
VNTQEVQMMNEPTRLAELTRGPTLTEIAQEAGTSLSYVSAVAAGRKKPSPKLMAAASVVLRLPVEVIFPEASDGRR